MNSSDLPSPAPANNRSAIKTMSKDDRKVKASEVARKESTDDEEEFDPVTDAVGEFGLWQLRLTFLLSLLNCPCTWHIFAPTFQSMEGDYYCAPPEDLKPILGDLDWKNISQTWTDPKLNGESSFDPCNMLNLTANDIYNFDRHVGFPSNTSKIQCSSWIFDESDTGRTIVSQWSLVCSRNYLRSVADMTFLVGVALGGVFSGFMSDRFGRKRTLMASLSLQIVIGTILAATPWLELYLVLRFLLGFVSVSVVFSGFVICMEIVGGKWRTISGVSYLFPVPLSYITIAGIAYLVRGWQYQQLAITLPSILLLSIWWLVPESPRWLLAMGRTEDVLAILKRATEVNERPPPLPADKFIAQMKARSPASSDNERIGKPGFLDLFRTSAIRKNSLLLYILWFVLYFVYYGLVLNLSNIGGNIYVNTVLSGAVELPAIGICILFLLRMGRRWPLCLSMLGAGLSCLFTLTVPRGRYDLEWVTVTMAMAGKFSISTSNAMLPVFTAELFPTVVRNLGVGSSNIPAGVALMLVPYLWDLSAIAEELPMGTLGILGLLGGISVIFLPETANQRLPQTIEEGEEMARKCKQKKEECRKKKESDSTSDADKTKEIVS